MRVLPRSQTLFITVIGIVALITMALLPANATGQQKDTPFGLTVMGKPVTEENKDDILGDDTKSMSYDPEKRILRLENLTLGDTSDDTTIASSDTLTIEVIGKNTITTQSSTIKSSVLETKGLVFEGDGSLEITAASSTHGTNAIVAEDDDIRTKNNGIEVNGPTITAKSGAAARGGATAVLSAGPIIVNGGALKATSDISISGSSGIITRDTLTVNGGVVEAQGGGANKFDDEPEIAISSGISAAKGISINGGEVTAQGPTDRAETDYLLAFEVEEGTVDIADNLKVIVSKSTDGSNPTEWDRSTPLHNVESPYQYVKVTSSGQTSPGLPSASPSTAPANPGNPTSTAPATSATPEAEQ